MSMRPHGSLNYGEKVFHDGASMSPDGGGVTLAVNASCVVIVDLTPSEDPLEGLWVPVQHTRQTPGQRGDCIYRQSRLQLNKPNKSVTMVTKTLHLYKIYLEKRVLDRIT